MASERWHGGSTRAWRVQRARILTRDGQRCTFVDDEGVRCAETEGLEVHHAEKGADKVVDDAELHTHCAAHHALAEGRRAPEARRTKRTTRSKHRFKLAALDVRELPIEQLLPAEWNANRVPPGTLQKIKRSIEQFGVVENLVVRPHPGEPGRYEVLSGNHRLQLFSKLGQQSVHCHVVELDDARARVLAQALNRTRGTDDPQALARLMAEIEAAMPAEEVALLLPAYEELPRAFTRSEQRQRSGDLGIDLLRPIAPLKLGLRLEACCHLRRLDAALELRAGFGQLSHWYARLFKRLVRVDASAEGRPDVQLEAADYLRTRLLSDGPFDLIDLDAEGCPWRELDALFEVAAGADLEPFVLCVSDGLAQEAGRDETLDLQRLYRWPEPASPQLLRRLPELLDHGVRTRAQEAGYTASLIAADWKPSQSALYGSWEIGPAKDTRSEYERRAELGAPEPEAYGAWRIELGPRETSPIGAA
jgi:hypothetical protein